MKLLTDENRKKIVDALFYIALTIELVLMIVEKSELPFTYESYVFRATFLLTFLAVLIMKHDRKEWIFIAVIWAIAAVSYYICGKNDMLRVVTLLMAARDIDLKKAMKYCFYVCIVGFMLIALLACAGVLGNIVFVFDYGRGVGEETRYTFGFGHPNTLFSSVFVLILMWIWIYGRTAGVLPYIVLVVSSVIITVLTKSRTSALILAATIVLAIVFRLFPKLADLKVMYILETLISPVFCIVISVLAAGWTGAMYVGDKFFWNLGDLYWKVEKVLNYRMSTIYYEAANRDAVLSKWKLFSAHGTDSYFDMGFVRIFYWYGIIPAVLLVIALLAVIYMCWKKKDIWTMILIFALSVYTIVEATFVTRYLGRDFFLLIAGVYLGYYFKDKGESDVGKA
ncbi:hypothetical protein [Butyrivibrio sp. VCB2001]|uniref:hypothetical protein n=1 Tax=Butyrivibrio sp. VCB2001 TaxID=1280667 RepID=UPI000420ECAB|nr:hypothetical protein [Butyrivibrio sp. VCB2001]